MYVCMYVCMCVCMYMCVCMCVCMYVSNHVQTHKANTPMHIMVSLFGGDGDDLGIREVF